MRGRVPRTLCAVIALVATTIGCGVSMPGTGHRISVTAQFDNANGLYEGNVVAVLGMPVGKVESITPKGSYVEVVLDLDGTVDLPADVQAVTVSTSVLTDRHVELTPPYRDGAKLRDHDVIGRSRTKTPVEFDRVLAMVDQLSTELEGDRAGSGPIAQLLTVGSDITRGHGTDIRTALGELSEALKMHTKDGAPTREALTSIIRNLSSLSEAAAANQDTIRQFGSAVGQLGTVLAQQNVGSGNTGAKLNEILQQTTELLQDNRDRIKAAVGGTNTVVQSVTDYRRQVADAVDVLPLLADNVYNAIDQTNGALRAHLLVDKLLFDGQMTKEVCNLLGRKDLGCNTGTIMDYGPDFGMTAMLSHVAGVQ